ncbi:MAG: DUF6460 domain-containing protein [Geminicoccaceae bacterium]|nr:DUF6460 domain-containing protein [Geminicoccaceae bacterium]MCX8101557.1 DUF6460 domain-containing protein [Geminicoccaceae bacterium]MDW8369132.1 DUF6460 domain-containing protein [Geminicoccaceae bacterium]
MPRITAATVVKLVVASILVGAAMAFLDVQPLEVWRWLAERVGDVLADIRSYATRALTYLLLGAVVVVPVWLVFYLWRALRGKS